MAESQKSTKDVAPEVKEEPKLKKGQIEVVVQQKGVGRNICGNHKCQKGDTIVVEENKAYAVIMAGYVKTRAQIIEDDRQEKERVEAKRKQDMAAKAIEAPKTADPVPQTSRVMPQSNTMQPDNIS